VNTYGAIEALLHIFLTLQVMEMSGLHTALLRIKPRFLGRLARSIADVRNKIPEMTK